MIDRNISRCERDSCKCPHVSQEANNRRVSDAGPRSDRKSDVFDGDAHGLQEEEKKLVAHAFVVWDIQCASVVEECGAEECEVDLGVPREEGAALDVEENEEGGVGDFEEAAEKLVP